MDLLQHLKNNMYQHHPQTKGHFEKISFQYSKVIFAKRIHLGFTQRKLAELSGVSLKTITRIEAGSTNVTVDSFEKVFDALEMTIQEVSKAIVEMNEADDETVATI